MAKQQGKIPPDATESQPAKNQRPTVMFDGVACHVNVLYYISDPIVLGIQLNDAETEEPYTIVTTNLGAEYREGTLMPKYSAYIDTNNNDPRLLQDFFQKTGGEQRIVFGYPYTKQSGWCEYPVFDFNPEALKKLDPDGFKQYSETYDKELPKEQEKLMQNMFSFNPFTDDEKEESPNY